MQVKGKGSVVEAEGSVFEHSADGGVFVLDGATAALCGCRSENNGTQASGAGYAAAVGGELTLTRCTSSGDESGVRVRSSGVLLLLRLPLQRRALRGCTGAPLLACGSGIVW
jgi:hypothetical protein